MGRISIVQIITDGNRGFPHDNVIQVGVSEIDPDVNETIGENLITVCPKDCSDRSESGLPIDEAAEELRTFLNGKSVTSFDVRNTFSRYLVFEPWDLTYDVEILPSVSVHLPNNLRLRTVPDENMNIEKAYTVLTGKDIPERKDALTYARMSSEILTIMRARGLY